MHFSRLQRIAASALLLVFPLAVTATDWSGMITTSTGAVSVNGQAVRGSYALVSGDQVQTGNGQAMIRLNGGTVTLAKNSLAQFSVGAVTVSSGFAQISTSIHVSSEFENLSIRPATPQATYSVGMLNGRPTIAVSSGSLEISDGENVMVLDAGNAIAPVDKKVQQDQQAPVPAVSGTKAKPPKSSEEEERGGRKKKRGVFMLPGWQKVAIIGGVAGAVLLGLYLGGVFGGGQASPSKP